MKRVVITPEIESLLKASFGADHEVSSTIVFEAIALNTLPLRKRHPLYKDARAERGLLQEMAAALNTESRPVHIQHDTSLGLPLGRVFHGQFLEKGTDAELRVLFSIDASETEAVTKIEAGSVDQVSVSILPKHLYNSVSGFDYLGPDADFETFYSGTDPDGNVLGEAGVYARMDGLDAFFEMSLVGQGGAQNARIVRREESHFGSSYQKLAASGMDPNAIVLVASIKADDMDLTTLITQLTDAKSELVLSNTAKSAVDTQLATLTASNTALQAQLTALGEPAKALATLTAEKATADVALAAATVGLQKVAKALLTASGNLTAEVPSDVAALTALIDTTQTSLAAHLVANGRSISADGQKTTAHPAGADLSAFTAR